MLSLTRAAALALVGLQFSTHVLALTAGTACSDNPVVPNAVAGLDCVSGGPVADQATCVISCASGFAPATQSAVCKDGIWSEVPVCRPTGATADCVALPVLPVLGTPASFSCTAPAAHGADCSFSCSEGFAATGAFKCFDSVWSVESCQLARVTPATPSATTGFAIEGASAAVLLGSTSPVVLVRTGVDALDSTATSIFVEGVDLVASLAALTALPSASPPAVGTPSLLLDDDAKASISFEGAPELLQVPATSDLAVNGPALIDGYALAAALRSMGASTTSPAAAAGSVLELADSAALSFGDADDVFIAASGSNELSFSGRLMIQGRDLVALAKTAAAEYIAANTPTTTTPPTTTSAPAALASELVTPVSVVASLQQSDYFAVEAIDGIAREAPSDNGWAYQASPPASIVFGLGAATLPVAGIWILSGVARSDHHPNDFTIDFTTDPSPGIGSTFSPVTNIQRIGAAPGIAAAVNRVTLTGQELLFLQFDVVQATGVRLTVAGSDAGNDNSVLTEARILLNNHLTFVTPFAADAVLHQAQHPAAEAADGIVGDPNNGWAHVNAVDPFIIFRATASTTLSTIVGARIYSGQARTEHETVQFAIEYTTDPTPTLSGTWTALPDNGYFIGSRLGGINGNVFNNPGAANIFEIMWDPLLATGIKFRSLQASTANGNIVLNEVELLLA